MVTGVESQPLYYIELIEAGRYCTYKGQEDWRGALKDCSKGEAMTFLRYICERSGEFEGIGPPIPETIQDAL